MASVIIVAEEDLGSTPEAFRQYVADHFVRRKILGVQCAVAEAHVIHPKRSYALRNWGNGLAPRHSVDLSRYRDGLRDDQSLNDWIRSADRKGIITELHVTDQDGYAYEVD